MSWLSNLFPSFFSQHNTISLSQPHCPSVNPATGLPMANCSMDVAGNPYGTSSMNDEYLSTSCNIMDDDFNDHNDSCNIMDDDFNDHNDSFNSWSDDDSWGSTSWDDT